jgi:hypothetical protein
MAYTKDETLKDVGMLIVALHDGFDAVCHDAEDALNQDDTISIGDLDQDVVYSDLTRAGIAEPTSIDKFIQMNGDTSYVERI